MPFDAFGVSGGVQVLIGEDPTDGGCIAVRWGGEEEGLSTLVVIVGKGYAPGPEAEVSGECADVGV